VRSHTRRLTGEFIARWRQRHPRDRVTYRDLGAEPPPPVTQDWIAAAFCAPDSRTPAMRSALEPSDRLIDELLAVDVLVLGVPMYNFGIPATLKAYKPLAVGKRAIVIVASGDGGYEPGGALAPLNQVEPYLRTVLGFIGIRDVDFVYVGNDEFGGERLARSLEQARGELAGHASLTSSAYGPQPAPGCARRADRSSKGSTDTAA